MTELIMVLTEQVQARASAPQKVFSSSREQEQFHDCFFKSIKSDLEDYRRAHRESEIKARNYRIG